jgi:hypothetical protein
MIGIVLQSHSRVKTALLERNVQHRYRGKGIIAVCDIVSAGFSTKLAVFQRNCSIILWFSISLSFISILALYKVAYFDNTSKKHLKEILK